ncbi:hypothetical protein CERZMDRAFT_82298 [Cercospora zeae-maydis SCOH1-5]|uniref:Uncharacterized protein n=1 Tax=Cercospora zeae-maydis SCOH1-5 TaxID=717836 RepID=A0A6A6FP63_9PEZI|nr:hypothetical protein CERZMDRAFT_82298 [Cercospora zeae-maydis SCOH1-5]
MAQWRCEESGSGGGPASCSATKEHNDMQCMRVMRSGGCLVHSAHHVGCLEMTEGSGLVMLYHMSPRANEVKPEARGCEHGHGAAHERKGQLPRIIIYYIYSSIVK